MVSSIATTILTQGNAAKEVSGTFKELEHKRDKIKKLIKHHINEHKQLDKDASREEARIKRAKQATKTLTAAFDKIDKFYYFYAKLINSVSVE